MPTKIAGYLHLSAFTYITLSTLLFASLANSQSIAFTFDDGPVMADNTGLSAAERNAAILGQLAEAHLKSILFVSRTDADKERNDLIREWGKGGHQIGNHTATHPNFEEVGLYDFERELVTCDKAIRNMPGFTQRFRFPYLKEGNTAEKRDGFRAFLDLTEYKPGPVSVDASDWYYSQRLSARLKKNPNANRLPYRDA